MMYRGFKQECPNGAVNEDTFKEIYEKFFPYGSKQNLNDVPELIKKITVTQKKYKFNMNSLFRCDELRTSCIQGI